MKRKMLLFLCICMIVVMPMPANGQTWVADEYDENGTPIFYIDMAPEEWERTYLNHPVFQSYRLGMEVVFRLRDIQTRAICYNCGRNSMTLQQEWDKEMKMTPIACPGGMGAGDLDFRYANAWKYRDYCNSCGPLGVWRFNDRRTWDWYIECNNATPYTTYKIVVGGAPDDGYEVHRCVSISESAMVHGYDCYCPNGDHYAWEPAFLNQ